MKKFALLLLLLACAGIGFWKFREHSASSATSATTPNGAQSPHGAPAPSNSTSAGGNATGGAPAPGGVQSAKGGPGSPGGRGGDGAPVPVVVGEVTKSDLPLFLSGLGNVQGFNTVTIRSRVDGQLEKVSFSEGQDVKEGDVLAQIDPRPFQAALDQAKALRMQNEAQLANAKLDLERDVALFAGKAGTAQKADTQRALVNQLEATLRANDAAIEAAKVQLNYATIRSPISGRTGIRLLDAGNVVRATDSAGLVVITQMKPINVLFTLSEQHLPLIQQEAKNGKLPVFALDRGNSTRIATGELTVIDNQIDSTTGTIRLKATFPNEDLKLWPGQFINVRLQVSVRKDALTVPASVVQRGPSGTYAYLVTPGQTAEMRPVVVDRIEEGMALIASGLQPGDKVITDGHYRVQPGAKLKIPEAGGASEPGRRRTAETAGHSKP
jgi:multidrug efflux system membrane fusion protein